MKSRSPYLLLTCILLLAAIFLAGPAAPVVEATPSAVAFDMVGSASQNLTSFTDDPAIPFSSPADGFNKFQRGVSPTIPFDVLDDSAGSYPAKDGVVCNDFYCDFGHSYFVCFK